MRILKLALAYALLSLLFLILDAVGLVRLVPILTYAYIMSVFALSFALLLGYLGLLNFGHALFFGLGAYITAYQLMWYNIPWFITILTSLIVGASVGVVFALIVRKAFSGIPFAFITLTVLMVVYFLYRRRELREISGSEQGLLITIPEVFKSTIISYIPIVFVSAIVLISLYLMLKRPHEHLNSGTKILLVVVIALIPLLVLLPTTIAERDSSLKISPNLYIVSLTLMILSYSVLEKILKTPLGTIWVSIRENELRMESLGYNTFLYKTIAMAISGALAAMSGSIYTVYAYNINPDRTFSPLLSVYGLIYTIIGGVYPIVGPILGAVLVTIAERFVADYVGGWSLVFVGGLFISIIMVMPHGIIFYVKKPRAMITSLKQIRRSIMEAIKGRTFLSKGG